MKHTQQCYLIANCVVLINKNIRRNDFNTDPITKCRTGRAAQWHIDDTFGGLHETLSVFRSDSSTSIAFEVINNGRRIGRGFRSDDKQRHGERRLPIFAFRPFK